MKCPHDHAHFSRATIGIELLYAAIPTEQRALRLALPVPEIDARTRDIQSRIIELTLLALFPAIFLLAAKAFFFSADSHGDFARDKLLITLRKGASVGQSAVCRGRPPLWQGVAAAGREPG